MEDIRPVADAVPPEQVNRVLVVKLRHHGDVLLTSPVFTALKRWAPHAAVDALVYADTAAMLTLHPAISEVHCVNRAWKKLGPFDQLAKEWHLFRVLRESGYDLIVHLTEHWRGAWMARLLGARWAVAMRRHSPRWRDSFTHLYTQPRNSARHTIESNLDALRRIGIYPAPEERRLLLVPGYEAEGKVGGRLRELGVAPGEFIHVHPASRWFFKCWPANRMAALIDLLHEAGRTVVLSAAPSRDEQQMIDAIQSRLKRPAHSLAGELSLKEMAALAGYARLFIGVDSAPMHIAAAMGTPVVALFGPSGEKQWGPWGVPHRVVSSGRHACRPCGIDGCGGGKVSDCLVTLTPAEVFAAAEELLAGTVFGGALPATREPLAVAHPSIDQLLNQTMSL